MAKLPSFLVIGASKCGTSSLHEYLRQHPHISLPIRKETHFFIYDRDSEYQLGEERDLVNKIDNLQDYLAEFEQKDEPVTYGEVDPKYIDFPNAAKNIKHYIPDVKLACLLRNPVDRFYSGFNFLRLKRSDLGGFKEVIDSIRNNQMDIHTRRALEVGFYYKNLSVYFDLFPKENIRVFLFDDLIKKPKFLLKTFLEFIEVEDFDFATQKKFNPSGTARFGWIYRHLRDSKTAYFLRKHLPAKIYHFTRRLGEKIMIRPYQPLSENERKFLQDIYRDDIEHLQTLTDLDLSSWLA